MSLPDIAPYDVPEVPTTARVDWLPDPDRAVLLVHDMQEYFLAAFDRTAEPARGLVERIAALAAVARAHGVPVVYTCQPGDQHRHRRGLLADFWGRGMASGPATAVVSELTPGPDDIVVTKWRYSAFERTDLRPIMARTGRDQLIVTGVYAHLGCQVSAVDAFMGDIQSFMVSDAVADFSREHHERALEYVAAGCGRVLDTAAVLDHLDRPGRPLHSVARVATDRADRYARQLLDHLGRKVSVVAGGQGHHLHFPLERGIAASARVAAAPDSLLLEVRAADDESLATAQRVVGGHLERFGARDELEVSWS